MKTTPQAPVQPVQGTKTVPQRPGPVPLDPQLFRLVSGGLPRGGGWEL